MEIYEKIRYYREHRPKQALYGFDDCNTYVGRTVSELRCNINVLCTAVI